MATLALPPQPLPAIVDRAQEWMQSASGGNGVEASQMSVLADEVWFHWSQRIEILIPALEVLNSDSYIPVPPNRVSYVKTRYTYKGKGKPMPFDLGDE